MIFYDGNKLAEIIVWASNDEKEENRYDFTNDFFDTGAFCEVGEYDGKPVYWKKDSDIDSMVYNALDFFQKRGDYAVYENENQYRDFESRILESSRFIEYNK